MAGDEASTGGPGSELAAMLARAAEEAGGHQTGGAPETVTGTDSEATAAPPVPPELADRLGQLGQRYLGYDYSQPTEERLASLEQRISPELYQSLTAPLPAALTATLVAERRVVTVEPVEVAGLEVHPGGGGVYLVSLTVTESRLRTGDVEVTERTQQLVMVVDAQGLVVDVR